MRRCEDAKTQRREDAKNHQKKIETVFVAVPINSGANQTVVQIKGCLSVAAMPHSHIATSRSEPHSHGSPAFWPDNCSSSAT